jgi:HPt (histidine-containing phosphotransfer) domain-containing protein
VQENVWRFFNARELYRCLCLIDVSFFHVTYGFLSRKATEMDTLTHSGSERCINTALCLKHSNGNPELAAKLLSLLLADLQTSQRDVHRALREVRFDEALELVHTLHGNSCYTGVPLLTAACRKLEQELKTQCDLPSAQALTDFDRAVQALLDWQEQHDVATLFANEAGFFRDVGADTGLLGAID